MSPEGDREIADEAVESFLQSRPFAFVGYRAMNTRGKMAESDEIPFSSSILFPVLLFGYLLVQRVARLGSRDDEVDPPDRSGHVFSITSSEEYRTKGLLAVAGRLQARGRDVVLLCSPAAEARTEEWRERGFDVVTHRSLHGRVVLRRYPGHLRETLRTTRELAEINPETPWQTLVRAFDLILLERIKHDSVRSLYRSEPSVHTYSPMPYLYASTESKRTFVYMHGIKVPEEGDFRSLPWYEPFVYLVWGEVWKEMFQEFVGTPGTEVLAVGNPWHDYLAEDHERTTATDVDVLFLGQSQGVGESEPEYERIVQALIETCESNDWTLAVKLHPREDRGWYDHRGWGEYVRQFEDIDEAIERSRLAVTDTSSAFVECVIMGKPVLVADIRRIGLAELGPIELVYFPEDPDDLREQVVAILTDGPRPTEEVSSELINLGGSIDRIVSAVEERTVPGGP